jgi:hypothetical protein
MTLRGSLLLMLRLLCLMSVRLLRLFLLGRLAWLLRLFVLSRIACLLRFLRLFLLLLDLLLALGWGWFLPCRLFWLLRLGLLLLGRLLPFFGLSLAFLFLLRRLGLRRLFLLFWSFLLFLFLLLLLRPGGNGKSEQQEQTCCADNSESFHVLLPPLLRFPEPGVMRSVLRLLPECEPRALAHNCTPAFVRLFSTNPYSRERMN